MASADGARTSFEEAAAASGRPTFDPDNLPRTVDTSRPDFGRYILTFDDRKFDFGVPDFYELHPGDASLGIDRVDWITGMTLLDPVLRRMVIHIRWNQQLYSILLSADDPDMNSQEGIPERLMVPGFETYLAVPHRARGFKLVSNMPGPRMSADCGGSAMDASRVLLCGITLEYQAPSLVNVYLRYYHPEPFPEKAEGFREIGLRALSVVRCLDVTNGGQPPDPPPQPYDENSLTLWLEACSAKLES